MSTTYDFVVNDISVQVAIDLELTVVSRRFTQWLPRIPKMLGPQVGRFFRIDKC